ncbi:hypothetical protein GCWU000246_00533 [Jonquetella anthropi E3_33 E1]|nr:hypothetical protein GCWU000246_00533 [Jonquetella anthropi E3_33 E1]
MHSIINVSSLRGVPFFIYLFSIKLPTDAKGPFGFRRRAR